MVDKVDNVEQEIACGSALDKASGIVDVNAVVLDHNSMIDRIANVDIKQKIANSRMADRATGNVGVNVGVSEANREVDKVDNNVEQEIAAAGRLTGHHASLTSMEHNNIIDRIVNNVDVNQ